MKMPLKYVAFFIAILLCSSLPILADVPPDAGFKRISLDLIIESETDFPDHRFFLKSGAELKEIAIAKGGKVTIEPLGGGAHYRSGTFLAVPKNSLEGLSDVLTKGNLSELQKTIYDGKAVGTLELVTHSFAREVPDREASGWKDPVYRIEPDAQVGVKVVHVSGGANESKVANAASSGLAFWRSAAAAVVAGIFLAFGLLILGVLYFRKSSKAL